MDWIPVIGVIGAIIAAFIGATVGGFLQHKWIEKHRRPILTIVDQDFIPGPNCRYHRVRVKNTGKSAAKNCIGKITLENVAQDDIADHTLVRTAGVVMSKNSFSELREESICWSRVDNPESIIINRDDTQLLDVYRASSDLLELPTEKGWSPFRVSLKAKEYSGEILVTSENAQTMRVKFKLVSEKGDVKFIILKTE